MTKSDLIWTTEKRKVKDLVPFEHNPRILTKKQAAELKVSLSKFNLVEIPVINSDNRIIAGHQRIALLQTEGRGEEEIDVRVPNRQLTEAEFQEYNLRSNKNRGEWDFEKLANTFEMPMLEEVGFTKADMGIADGPKEDVCPRCLKKKKNLAKYCLCDQPDAL